MVDVCNNRVDLWSFNTEIRNLVDYQAYKSFLNNNEITASNRIRCNLVRTKYIFSKFLVRSILSFYTGISPHALSFYHNRYGKPYICHSDLHFNISHSKQNLIIAISSSKIGVDLEYIDPKINYSELIECTLTDCEKNQINKLEPKKQLKQFYKFGAQKESILKAEGVGLSCSPKVLCVSNDKVKEIGTNSYNFAKYTTHQLHISDSNYIGFIAFNAKEVKKLNYIQDLHLLKFVEKIS